MHLPTIRAMARATGVPVAVYRQLLELNVGFDQAQRALNELQRARLFKRSELERFTSLAAEARAAAVSYLVEVIETVETEQAGRLFRLRSSRERREQSG